MTEPTKQLKIVLAGGLEATAKDLEKMGQTLYKDLLKFDVPAVDPAEREAPDGSKAGLVIDWNTLLVTLVSAGGVITTVITAVQGWLLRNREACVTLSIEGDELIISGGGPYTEEQKQAIDLWLSRHKGYVLPQ